MIKISPKIVTISGSYAEDLRKAIMKRVKERRKLEELVWRQIGEYATLGKWKGI